MARFYPTPRTGKSGQSTEGLPLVLPAQKRVCKCTKDEYRHHWPGPRSHEQRRHALRCLNHLPWDAGLAQRMPPPGRSPRAARPHVPRISLPPRASEVSRQSADLTLKPGKRLLPTAEKTKTNFVTKAKQQRERREGSPASPPHTVADDPARVMGTFPQLLQVSETCSLPTRK